MKNMLLTLLLPVTVGGCGLFADDEGLPPDSVLSGEPRTFKPAPDGPFEPGRYVVRTELTALDGKGLDRMERRVAWEFYASKAAAPLEFCITPEQAQLGMAGMAQAIATDGCSIAMRPDDAEITTACPTPQGMSYSVTQRGEGDGSPDLRQVARMPDGLGRTAELVWHITLERAGDCPAE